jgi:hypothetical protein
LLLSGAKERNEIAHKERGNMENIAFGLSEAKIQL